MLKGCKGCRVRKAETTAAGGPSVGVGDLLLGAGACQFGSYSGKHSAFSCDFFEGKKSTCTSK